MARYPPGQSAPLEETAMTHPRLAMLSLVLAVALATPLRVPRDAAAQAAAQPSFDEIVPAQAAANGQSGPRSLPAHVVPPPTDEVSPQIQALIAGPYPP